MTRQLLAEKYRPSTIDGYVFLDPNLKRSVEKWIEKQDIPNILMVGSAGCGKTTLSRILIKELDIPQGDVKQVNCSAVKGMEFIREILEPWLKKAPYGRFKVVQLEEMDRLGQDAQKALRAIIEDSSASGTRFIGTANYAKGIIPEMYSRFEDYDINAMDDEGIIEYMVDVIEQEQIIVEDENVFFDHIDAYKPDIRKILNSIEAATDSEGKLHPPQKITSKGTDLDQWESLWKGEDFNLEAALELTELIDPTNYDWFYEVMYSNLHQFEDKGAALVLLSQYLDRSQTSANLRLHLDAFLYHAFVVGGE